MFGLFKRKQADLAPDEPVRIEATIEIDRSAAEVYALLDFGDPGNQMVVRGNTVKPIGSQPGAYRLWYELAPDLNFLFTETDAVPGERYAYSAMIVPPVGLRTGSHEDYTLEPLGDGRCSVTFLNTIYHRPGLTTDQLAEEIGRSSVAAASGLAKLKILAEQGVAAVEAFEREQGHR